MSVTIGIGALSEREKQVLTLIARGRTNAEIAEELGIRFETAKWRVSEILSKLGVESREDAAKCWREYGRPRLRLARALRALLPGVGWLKVGGAIVAMIAASAAVVFVVVALRESGGNQSGAAGTPATQASPTATPAPAVIAIDSSPRAPTAAAATLRLGPPPASPFQPWDGKSTVIYDTKTGKEMNLGPGSQPAYFSPDSTKAVWTNGTDFASGIEAFVIDLASGAISSLGPATFAMFIDDTHVFIYKYKPGGNDSESIDLATGARGLSGGNPGQNIPPLLTPDGYEIVHWDGASFQVLESKTRQPVMSFDALDAVPVGAGQIAVASQVVGGQSNIFMVDVKTAMATFLATAAPGSGAWPFSANSQYVMWTDNYCGDPNGKVNLFDLKTKQLTQVDFSPIPSARWVKFTPSGLIAAGSFGAKYLIDPVALSYVAQIPQSGFGGGDVSWSPNYRYASHGPTGGHGGLCGG